MDPTTERGKLQFNTPKKPVNKPSTEEYFVIPG